MSVSAASSEEKAKELQPGSLAPWGACVLVCEYSVSGVPSVSEQWE